MFYEITVTRTVPVTETIKIDLLAEDDEEALDLAFEVATSFPTDMQLLVDRCTITERTYDWNEATVPDVDIVRHEPEPERA